MAKRKINSTRLLRTANDTGRDFMSGNFINTTHDYSNTFHKLGYGEMFKKMGVNDNDLFYMASEFGHGLLGGLSREESLLNGLNKARSDWQDRVDGKSLTGVDFSKETKAEAQRLLNATKGTHINYSEKVDRIKAKRERYKQLKEKYRSSSGQGEENKLESAEKARKKSVERHKQKLAPGKNSRRGSKYTYAMERAGEEKRAAHAASQRKAALKANNNTKRWKNIKGKFGKIAGAITSLLGRSETKVEKIFNHLTGRKYSKSRLEKEGVRRTSPSRDRDIYRKIAKTKGALNKEGQDDFITWLKGSKRVYGQEDKEKYSMLRLGQRLSPSVDKSVERHYSKENGIRRKGDRYDIVQAAHKPVAFRDFEAERLEKLENDRKAIQERQSIKIESPSTPPRSGEPVQQGAVQADAPEPTPAASKAEETTQGPIAQPQEASSTPTGNQQNAGATQGNAQTNNQEAAGATQGGGTTSNQEAAGATSGSGDDSYDAKLKALRKKGRANEYAADRIDQERKEVIDMINAGNYKDAAGALGFSGDYTAEKANELRQAAEKHAMDAVNEGAGIMDYVNAYHVPGAIGGAAILAGTGVALMGDNGRKSNEQLYSSPF